MSYNQFTFQYKDRIETYLYENFGWKIDLQEGEFSQKMNLITKELSLDSLDSCINFIEKNPKDVIVLKAMARHFSVGESYFFRDTHFCNRFENEIIPKLLSKGDRQLAVWSVGCSRGEELYSIAMMLVKYIPDIDKWNLYLLGTDVNVDVLNIAKDGIYTKHSLRQTSPSYLSYFDLIQEGYKLHPNVQKMANFKFHNILDSHLLCLPPDGKKFDLILINNILIYFEIESTKNIVQTLFSELSDGGWMVTTPTEYSMGGFDFTSSISIEDHCIIQKLSSTPFISMNEFDFTLDLLDLAVGDIVIVKEEKNDKTDLINLNEVKGDREYYEALKKLELGDLDGAKISLQHALYLNNKLIMPHILLVNLFKKERKPNIALKHLKNASMLLQRMNPKEEVELSDGINASDLLKMINAIKGETFEK